jgi:sec-independent protein translocase protein TatA
MYPHVIGGLGASELLIIASVLVLLFGASKLPELARGSGRALRIFKAETSSLGDDPSSELPVDSDGAPRVDVERARRPRRDTTR